MVPKDLLPYPELGFKLNKVIVYPRDCEITTKHVMLVFLASIGKPHISFWVYRLLDLGNKILLS